jgi:hypothetical protein
MIERRRYKRFTVNGKINGKVCLISDIDIQDISLSGIRFLTNKFISPGMKCNLTLHHKDCQIDLKGTVVRASLSGTKKEGDDFIPIFEVAVHFDPLDETTQKRLSEVLDSLQE